MVIFVFGIDPPKESVRCCTLHLTFGLKFVCLYMQVKKVEAVVDDEDSDDEAEREVCILVILLLLRSGLCVLCLQNQYCMACYSPAEWLDTVHSGVLV